MVHSGVLLIHLVVCLQPASNSEPVSQVRAWFDREWVASQHVPNLRDWNIRYTEEIVPTITAEEVKVLRRDIANKPDHPAHDEIKLFDEFVKNGKGYVIESQLFAGGDDAWRWCVSHPMQFWDSTLSKEAAWSLTSNSASIHEPTDSKSQPLKKLDSMLIPLTSRILYGGLGVARTSGLIIRDFEITSNNSWRAITVTASQPDSGYVQVFRGRWEEKSQRGFVEESLIYHQGYPGTAVERETFKDWRYSTDLSSWVSYTTERYDRRNRLSRIRRVVSITQNPAPLAEILRAPSLGVKDAIRGNLTISEVLDHREASYKSVDKNGEVTTGVIRTASESSTSTWRWIGWIALSGLTAAGIIHFRRKNT